MKLIVAGIMERGVADPADSEFEDFVNAVFAHLHTDEFGPFWERLVPQLRAARPRREPAPIDRARIIELLSVLCAT